MYWTYNRCNWISPSHLSQCRQHDHLFYLAQADFRSINQPAADRRDFADGLRLDNDPDGMRLADGAA
jgi:hypothetical protein